jgi:outer membrane protein assembly factor BamB
MPLMYAAACMATQYYPLPSGDVLFFCGSDLYRVHEGNLQWKFSWRSEYKTALLIDRAETVYAMEEDNRSLSNERESHVVAISSNGEKLWEVGLSRFKAQDLFLDAGVFM